MEKNSIDEELEKGIGSILREEREKRGLTREQVCEVIKLRPSIINAIEKEEWDELPPPVFVRGFIRSYARTLDLDPERFLKMYNSMGDGKEEDCVIKKAEGEKHRKWAFLWLFLIILVIMFMLLVAFGIKKHQLFMKRTNRNALKGIKKMNTVFVDGSVHFPAILEARVRKKIWLKIAVDRYKEEKYLLQPGECISWQIRKSCELIAGDAGGIDLWLNDSPIHFGKKTGQMLYVRLYSKKEKGVNKI